MKEDTIINVSAYERRYIVGELRLMGYDVLPHRPRNKDYQVIRLHTDTDELRDNPLYVRTGYDLRTEITTHLIEGLLINVRNSTVQTGRGVHPLPDSLQTGDGATDADATQRSPERPRQKPPTKNVHF